MGVVQSVVMRAYKNEGEKGNLSRGYCRARRGLVGEGGGRGGRTTNTDPCMSRVRPARQRQSPVYSVVGNQELEGLIVCLNM